MGPIVITVLIISHCSGKIKSLLYGYEGSLDLAWVSLVIFIEVFLLISFLCGSK